MEILLALVFGAVVGIISHFVIPDRSLRGVAFAPVLGACVGGVVWLALTWLTLTTTNPWLWIVSFAVPLVVVPAVLLLQARTRRGHDERERARLRIA